MKAPQAFPKLHLVQERNGGELLAEALEIKDRVDTQEHTSSTLPPDI